MNTLAETKTVKMEYGEFTFPTDVKFRIDVEGDEVYLSTQDKELYEKFKPKDIISEPDIPTVEDFNSSYPEKLKNDSVLGDKSVETFLYGVVKEEGVDVIEALYGREVTDEALAEETELKLNIVRKVLYRLYDNRLASYVRTKDPKIGWYIFTWKLRTDKIKVVIRNQKQRTLMELTQKLEYEQEHTFFSCTNDKSKIPFDLASECNFKCPHCDGTMGYHDNQGIILSLEEEKQKLEQEIKEYIL